MAESHLQISVSPLTMRDGWVLYQQIIRPSWKPLWLYAQLHATGEQGEGLYFYEGRRDCTKHFYGKNAGDRKSACFGSIDLPHWSYWPSQLELDARPGFWSTPLETLDATRTSSLFGTLGRSWRELTYRAKDNTLSLEVHASEDIGDLWRKIDKIAKRR